MPVAGRIRFAVPPPPPPPSLILDEISGAIHAYSFRRLTSTYIGNALRIVSSAGGNPTEQIGFDNNLLDESALTSFIGANNGFIDILYDQAGSRNFLQTNASFRPQLVSSGTIVKVSGKPYSQYDGSNDFMTTSDSLTPLLDKDSTVFVVFESQSSESLQGVFEEIRNDLTPADSRIRIASDTRNTGFLHSQLAPTRTSEGSEPVINLNFSNQQPTSTKRVSVYRKTSNLIEVFDENGLVDSDNYSETFIINTLLEIGRQLINNQYFSGKIAELIIFNRSLDNTELATVTSNIVSHYDI